MSIVACPRCGDKVSLPPAASPAALVQCPLCCEEYYLSDVLIQLPPMLVVVGGRAAAAEEGDYRLAEPVAAAVSQAAFDTGVGSSATRPQLRTVSRPRRQEKSAVGEIVKVVLGGAAGLAGGLLVLWWLFGVDVGELGPKLSKVDYLRFLVPEKLWDQSVRSGKGSAKREPVAADARQADDNGKKGNAVGGESRVAGDASGAAPVGSGSNEPEKNEQQADPFLSLDDFSAPSKPAAGDAVELTLDDPLSAVTPPKKGGAAKANDDRPAEPTGDSPQDKESNPQPPPDPAEEKPATPALPAGKATEEDAPDKPSAEKPGDEKKGAPAEEAAPE
ncbi:MAG TPA: hypothetical protein VMP01_06235 [Pirellulaceae bacterium]|nr:hypothetical protein [Pirellulaceae bacterium]